MSTTETPPPPDTPIAGPLERRCPRCGSALAADQEWCLNCGAAAGTEVVEPRGWRVPLYLGGGLLALAIIGVILAIVALTDRNDVVAGEPDADAISGRFRAARRDAHAESAGDRDAVAERDARTPTPRRPSHRTRTRRRRRRRRPTRAEHA